MDCHFRYAQMAIPVGDNQKEKGFIACGNSGLILYQQLKASFGCFQKNKAALAGKPFSFWVEDGIRTHDLRNHNPTF
jgi:hypothetical protein